MPPLFVMENDEQKYTEGSILRAVWRLAWPAVTSMFFQTFLSITDAFWVGKLGTEEMAAVTSSMFTMWCVFSVLIIIPTGLVAIISRAVGAGNTSEVSRISRQSISFSIWVGLAFSLLGYYFVPHIFDFMRTDETVSRLGISYLRIFFIGVVFLFINDAFSGIFRALGDAKAFLIASSTAVGVNIVLDPLLIFGWGPFPQWGTDGASVATVIAFVCGTLVYIIMLRRGRLGFALGFRLLEKIDCKLILTIIKIGYPPAVASTTFSVIYIFLNRIVAEFGTVSIAALMVGNRMESLSYLTCFGFSMAASTVVGQNLGAGQPARAAKSAWVSLGITVVFTTVISIIFLVFPRQLSAFFINDEQVIVIAVEYLRILALSQVFMAAEIVLEGAFNGAGDTIPPMAVSIPGSILRLPMAYYLCFTLDWGISGMWWTLTITTWLKAIVVVYWFSLGRWKKTGMIQA